MTEPVELDAPLCELRTLCMQAHHVLERMKDGLPRSRSSDDALNHFQREVTPEMVLVLLEHLLFQKQLAGAWKRLAKRLLSQREWKEPPPLTPEAAPNMGGVCGGDAARRPAPGPQAFGEDAMTEDAHVHHCNYASQPEIAIECGGWTTPAYNQLGIHVEPYRAENGQLYAFTDSLVTCPECLAKMRARQVERVRSLALVAGAPSADIHLVESSGYASLQMWNEKGEPFIAWTVRHARGLDAVEAGLRVLLGNKAMVSTPELAEAWVTGHQEGLGLAMRGRNAWKAKFKELIAEWEAMAHGRADALCPGEAEVYRDCAHDLRVLLEGKDDG